MIFYGTPAADDLEHGSLATQARQNINTKYHTISPNYVGWFLHPNGFFTTFEFNGNPYIPVTDDGLVPVDSVESKSYFHNIGHTSD